MQKNYMHIMLQHDNLFDCLVSCISLSFKAHFSADDTFVQTQNTHSEINENKNI